VRTAHLLGRCAIGLMAIAAAGCAETGDFGRPKPSIWNDVVLPATGSITSQVTGEVTGQTVSSFTLTDDEKELRDRAWRFLMPAHERSWFASILSNLARTRILPPTVNPTGVETYHRALVSGAARSPASRFRRLAEDAVVDRKLIAPFAVVATKVMAADVVRLRALSHVAFLTHADADDAVARVAENRCLIDWVRYETHARLEQYRYALEHLFIETPQGEAVPAERALAALAAQRQALEGLAAGIAFGWCTGADAGLDLQALPAPSSCLPRSRRSSPSIEAAAARLRSTHRRHLIDRARHRLRRDLCLFAQARQGGENPHHGETFPVWRDNAHVARRFVLVFHGQRLVELTAGHDDEIEGAADRRAVGDGEEDAAAAGMEGQ
jgi:hypothetical protein